MAAATIHYSNYSTSSPSSISTSTSSSSLHNKSSNSIIEKTNQQLKQETADLEKFSKFFILKAVQIIVQSRLLQQSHNKIKYPCKSAFSGDWFNLLIEDHPDILSATKSAIGCNNNALLNLPKCVVVQISLNHNNNHSKDSTINVNNKLVLEVWKLQLSNSNDFKCPSNNYCIASPTLYSVYNCMSMLLKSLITITRVLPAYRLCTRLSNLSAEEDDYEITYEIYTQQEEESDTNSTSIEQERDYINLLGNHHTSNILGSIMSSVGVIQLEYAYRTQIDVKNLEISSNKQHVDEMIMVNQDKQQDVIFPSQNKVPTSPKYSTPAFTDPLPPSFWDTPSTNISESCTNLEEANGYKIPFSNLLRRRSSTNSNTNTNTKSRHNSSSSSSSSSSETSTQVQNLISDDPLQEENQNIPISIHSNSNSTNSLNFSNQQTSSFEVVSMKPLPFAPTTSPTSSSISSDDDPTSFFNSLANPPILPSLENPSSSNIIIVTKQINEQLQRFEANAPMFDEFVSKLCSG